MFNYGVNYSQFKVVNNSKVYFLNISSSVYLQNTRIRKRILLHKLLETFHVLSLSVNLMLSAAQGSLRGAQSLAGGARASAAGGGRAARSSPRVAPPQSLSSERCDSLAAPLSPLRSATMNWRCARGREPHERVRRTAPHTRARVTAACFNIFVRNPVENCELVG